MVWRKRVQRDWTNSQAPRAAHSGAKLRGPAVLMGIDTTSGKKLFVGVLVRPAIDHRGGFAKPFCVTDGAPDGRLFLRANKLALVGRHIDGQPQRRCPRDEHALGIRSGKDVGWRQVFQEGPSGGADQIEGFSSGGKGPEPSGPNQGARSWNHREEPSCGVPLCA